MTTSRHIRTSKTARCSIAGSPSAGITDVWFACHGYGQLASDFISEFDCIASPHRLVVAPEALSRFYLAEPGGFHGPEAKIGATWMTREDREVEIDDYVSYLDDVYDLIFQEVDREKVKVTVLGFSQGGATANRWLTRGRARADRLLMWGCLLASDSDLNEAAEFFRDVELSIVYGTRDRFADTGMIADYEKLLRDNGVPFRLESFEGGHRMDRETLMRLADRQVGLIRPD
ncbi:MAG: alpha/beta hydrolase [Gemmatimonadaceae bacterium]